MSDVFVVKLGGTTLAEQGPILEEVRDVGAGRRLVVVHGGGRRLTQWLERLGVESRFEGGLRVTDEAAAEVATAVLGGVVNAELVSDLRRRGVDALGLTGVDGGLLDARRVEGLGRVASVVGVRRSVFDALFTAGLVPVVAPVVADEEGTICNVNADDAAAGIAASLGARLVLLTDVDGVRDGDGRKLDVLTAGAAERLIAGGIIGGGMVPKVRAGLAALRGGSDALIVDGAAPHALARAVADPAFGTRLVPS